MGHGSYRQNSGWKGRTLDYSLLRFQRALQALAAPAEVQLDLYLDFTWKVDEMAIEFDHWYQVVKRRRTLFTPEQSRLLEELNQSLDEISGPDNTHYWLEETLRTDSAWETIRNLAKKTLRALGWSVETPPKNAVRRGVLTV